MIQIFGKGKLTTSFTENVIESEWGVGEFEAGSEALSVMLCCSITYDTCVGSSGFATGHNVIESTVNAFDEAALLNKLAM